MRTKIKKSDPLYSFIKYREQKERKLFRDTPHIKLISGCILGVLILFLFSYFTRHCHPWFSSLLQSLGVGIITGLVVYVLSNMRNQREKYVSYVLKQLTEIYGYEVKIYNVIPSKMEVSCSFSLTGKKLNWAEKVYEAFEATNNYINALKNLEFSLLRELVDEKNVDFSKMEGKLGELYETIPDEITASYCWELSGNLIKLIDESGEWIEEKRVDFEILHGQLSKYPL